MDSTKEESSSDDKTMISLLSKAVENWKETALQNLRNAEYYRGLLERCGKAIGDRAYTQDDGGRSESVLCCKIPEIIEADYVHGGG
jgi:hypothetical protein